MIINENRWATRRTFSHVNLSKWMNETYALLRQSTRKTLRWMLDLENWKSSAYSLTLTIKKKRIREKRSIEILPKLCVCICLVCEWWWWLNALSVKSEEIRWVLHRTMRIIFVAGVFVFKENIRLLVSKCRNAKRKS